MIGLLITQQVKYQQLSAAGFLNNTLFGCYDQGKKIALGQCCFLHIASSETVRNKDGILWASYTLFTPLDATTVFLC